MADPLNEQQRFQWKKKLLLFGSMVIVGLAAILIFAGC